MYEVSCELVVGQILRLLSKAQPLVSLGQTMTLCFGRRKFGWVCFLSVFSFLLPHQGEEEDLFEILVLVIKLAIKKWSSLFSGICQHCKDQKDGPFLFPSFPSCVFSFPFLNPVTSCLFFNVLWSLVRKYFEMRGLYFILLYCYTWQRVKDLYCVSLLDIWQHGLIEVCFFFSYIKQSRRGEGLRDKIPPTVLHTREILWFGDLVLRILLWWREYGLARIGCAYLAAVGC